MRITLFTLGSRGDAQPYAALGLALKAQGQTVTVCASENFREFFTGLGLEYVSASWDTRSLIQDPNLRGRLLKGSTLGFFLGMSKEFSRHQDALFEAWLGAVRRADVLVSATTTDEFLALLGRSFNKPVIYTELMPFTPSSDYASIATGLPSLGSLNYPSHWLVRQAWWNIQRPRALALSRLVGTSIPWTSPALADQRSGAPVLHGYSEALFPTPKDWSGERHYISGAWRLESADSQALPGDHCDRGFEAWLEDGPPPLYLGFGSMPALDGAELLELAGDLAEMLNLRVVLGAGWTEVPGADCDLPEGVAISVECDHAWLFERCCAVAHHGGAGTTHAAAASGLPQVVCPVFADQPFWAERVRLSGAAAVLPLKRLNVERLARAFEEVLQGPCQDAAAALAARIRAESGAAGAAKRLMQWVGAGRALDLDSGRALS